MSYADDKTFWVVKWSPGVRSQRRSFDDLDEAVRHWHRLCSRTDIRSKSFIEVSCQPDAWLHNYIDDPLVHYVEVDDA
jgi:hypothetical protein